MSEKRELFYFFIGNFLFGKASISVKVQIEGKTRYQIIAFDYRPSGTKLDKRLKLLLTANVMFNSVKSIPTGNVIKLNSLLFCFVSKQAFLKLRRVWTRDEWRGHGCGLKWRQANIINRMRNNDWCTRMAVGALFQYYNHLSRYTPCRYKDRTVPKQSKFCNRISYSSKMAYLYWIWS